MSLLSSLHRRFTTYLNQRRAQDIPQPLEELLLGQIGRYYERVRPNIEKGEYALASGEMEDVLFNLTFRWNDIKYSNIPSSWNMVIGARQLRDALRQGAAYQQTILGFEAYAAQVKMHLERLSSTSTVSSRS
jgi:hypothetical protein